MNIGVHRFFRISVSGFLEQNITRDIEIKNKPAVTRGERDHREKKGKGRQGTGRKDTWTKPKGGRLRVGGGGEWEAGNMVIGKWRQQYLNNNKKRKIKKKNILMCISSISMRKNMFAHLSLPAT